MSNTFTINQASGSSPAPKKPNFEAMRYLVNDYMPDAIFISGGALRAGRGLRLLNQYLETGVGCRKLSYVADVMPCLWSLNWSNKSSALNDHIYTVQLQCYAKAGLPVGLCFDNPFITQEMLSDAYGQALVNALLGSNPTGQNFVCVASDALRDLLKKKYPKLIICAHQNRIIADMVKRTASFYNTLAERYDKVILHPADGSRSEITKDLKDKNKFVFIVNDPCLRTCPVRRDHLRCLSACRLEPFKVEHQHSIAKLIQQTACMEPAAMLSGQSSNLSRAQLEALYADGFRYFAFQSQRFEQMATLLSDIMNTLFTAAPEHTHQVSTLQANFYGLFSTDSKLTKSGIGDFDFV